MFLDSTRIDKFHSVHDFINLVRDYGLGPSAHRRMMQMGAEAFYAEFNRNPVSAKRRIIKQDMGVIVTCKGRLGQLRETMPHVLHDRILYILVDYDSPDNPWGYTASFGMENIICLHVAHKPVFCKGDAINHGIVLGRTLGLQKILLLDADTLVHDMERVVQFLDEQVLPGKFGIVSLDDGGRDPRDLTGILAFHMRDFVRIGQYPVLQGWGGEDILARILLSVQAKADFVDIPHEWFGALRHSDDLRSQYYQESNIALSDARNTAFAYRTALDLFREYGYRDISRILFQGAQFRDNLSIEK